MNLPVKCIPQELHFAALAESCQRLVGAEGKLVRNRIIMREKVNRHGPNLFNALNWLDCNSSLGLLHSAGQDMVDSHKKTFLPFLLNLDLAINLDKLIH